MTQYDRTVEDLGNVVALEHVNTRVPDQRLATLFYVTGLGLTRDPYLMTGVTNMWVNVGRSQFHLPTGKPQVVRGHTCAVIPGREALLRRLHDVRPHLEGTRFAFDEQEEFVAATCPWGNRIRCHAPGGRFGRMMLGIPRVELDIPVGTVEGIVRFYARVLETPALAAEDDLGRSRMWPSAPDRSSFSARAMRSRRSSTATTSPSILRTFPGPTVASSSAAC